MKRGEDASKSILSALASYSSSNKSQTPKRAKWLTGLRFSLPVLSQARAEY